MTSITYTDASLYIFFCNAICAVIITILKESYFVVSVLCVHIISKLIILPNVIGAKLTPFILLLCVCVYSCIHSLMIFYSTAHNQHSYATNTTINNIKVISYDCQRNHSKHKRCIEIFLKIKNTTVNFGEKFFHTLVHP